MFVPVVVYNNKSGKDERLLKSFNEPSWNNPVVRYINKDGSDVIPRKDRVWTTGGTAQRMTAALYKYKRAAPKYLEYVVREESIKTETAEFAMYCYWSGEVKLGSLKGVHSTRSGWRNGLEVVSVKYDPTVIKYETLLGAAQKFDCATAVFTHTDAQQRIATAAVGGKAKRVSGQMRDAKASDQKYQLLQTPLRYLPMTEMQATKVNSGLGTRANVKELLSPRQQQILNFIGQVQKKDKTALAGMTPPTDSGALAKYQQQLLAKIHSVLGKK